MVFGGGKNDPTNSPPAGLMGPPMGLVSPMGSGRSITADEFAAGFLLQRAEFGETHDFSMPEDAQPIQDWLDYGACSTWARIAPSNFCFHLGTTSISNFTAFPGGELRLHPASTNTSFNVFSAPMGMVPRSRWAQSGLAASRAWMRETETNSLVFTWQGALFGRETNSPVNVQAEFFDDGRFVYRYDLARLPDEVGLPSARMGASNEGVDVDYAWQPESLRTLTSLWFHPVHPDDAWDGDRDGDGISTADELFVYGTDPGSADTDEDGVSDYDEIMSGGMLDPLDPYSNGSQFCDGVAMAFGGVDPFSCPQGSTNTVYEHWFYSGTTNGVFSLPESSDSTAVLKVIFVRRDCGELLLKYGDTVRILPMFGDDGQMGELRVAVPRGVRIEMKMRHPASAAMPMHGMRSDDFCYGELPTTSVLSLWRRGWIVFPNVIPSPACIHDFRTRSVAVSLDPGPEVEGLTCSWNVPEGNDDCRVANNPPLSSTIYGDFDVASTGMVGYSLSHPKYLYGQTEYTQQVRFCPRPDPSPGSPSGHEDATAESFDDIFDGSLASEDHLCWCREWNCCGTGCSCLCHGEQGSFSTNLLDSMAAHVAYTNALDMTYPELSDVVHLHRHPDETLAVHFNLDGERVRGCNCSCPSHREGCAQLAYCSPKLSVRHGDGSLFSSTDVSGYAYIHGESPSREIRDATAAFTQDGVMALRHDCTVLGLAIQHREYDLQTVNGLDPSGEFGLPMVVCTNFDRTCELLLRNDVGLSTGQVNLSLECTNGEFKVWQRLPDWSCRLLLDSGSRTSITLPIADWRRLVADGASGSGSVLPVLVTASEKGRCRLSFGYSALVSDPQAAGADSGQPHSISDLKTQVITAIDPPLLPDYNRDGRIDRLDVEKHLDGATFRYWTNEDRWKGEETYNQTPSTTNGLDLVVNGRYDLQNLFPLKLDVSQFLERWGDSAELRICIGGGMKFQVVDVQAESAGRIYTNDVSVAGGTDLLHCAQLLPVPDQGVVVDAVGFPGLSSGPVVMACEMASNHIGRLDFVVERNGEAVYRASLPVSFSSVRDMYRWINVRGAAGENVVDATNVNPPWNNPDEENLTRTVFFTHGFNVSQEEGRNWGDQLFKRFWLSGSRAKFCAMTWHGDYRLAHDWNPVVVFNALHYQQDVYHAMLSAGTLKGLVESVEPTPANRVLMTQSLGNVLGCEMLLRGLEVDRYFMFDAALATEAVDGSLQAEMDGDPAFGKYVPPSWRDYTNLCWAANWHRWFAADGNDARGHMGWRGRYTSALSGNASEVFNYYSTGDEVFHEAANPPWLLQGMTESTANYCWQKQETLKGSGQLAGTLYAGWQFHGWIENELVIHPGGMTEYVEHNKRYTAQEAADMVANGSVTNTPVFERGYAPMFNRDATTNEVSLALGKYIPAVSSPMGGNSVFEGEDRNVDMNQSSESGVLRPNGWGRAPKDNKTPWLHSDMKDMAYYYIYTLYEQLIEKGNLR